MGLSLDGVRFSGRCEGLDCAMNCRPCPRFQCPTSLQNNSNASSPANAGPSCSMVDWDALTTNSHQGFETHTRPIVVLACSRHEEISCFGRGRYIEGYLIGAYALLLSRFEVGDPYVWDWELG
jgi:hypothetical protein